MSATQKKLSQGVESRGETLIYNPDLTVVVTNPDHVLFQDRAMDPPDEGLVASFVAWNGRQIHNIGVRKNGTRVLVEGEAYLDTQQFDKDYDPANALVAGDTVPNIEIIFGRGRTTAKREANRRRRAELGASFTRNDFFFIEAKSWTGISDAQALEIMQTENEVRRDTSFVGRVEIAMRQLKTNNKDYGATARSANVSTGTIKNWEKLWACHGCVLAAVANEEIGSVLAWTYFPLVPREKHEELMRLFRASGARKGADAEATMVRLVDQVLGRKPAPAPAQDAAPASHTRASDPPADSAARSPATPPAHQTRSAPSSDVPKPAASVGAPPAPHIDNVSTLPKARDVHALRRGATGCRDASKAAKELNPLEARDLKIAALVLAHASGKDDALDAFPHIVAAMNGTYSPKQSATEEPTGS